MANYFRPTVVYLFHLDSHVYSSSIAASVLLGFFPFLVLLLSVSQNVLGWRGVADAIFIALRDLLPKDPGLVDFVIRNLKVAVQSRGKVEAMSIVALLFSSNGIFMPLEVAMNRLWGFQEHRSYWRNQLVSLGMTFLCGALALTAAFLTTANVAPVQSLIGAPPRMTELVSLIGLKAIALPFTTAILVLIYWLLPNGRVPLRAVLPWAALTAVAIELGRLGYTWAWDHMDFRRAYGPFFISITILLWGFFAAMIILAGAELASRSARLPAEVAEEDFDETEAEADSESDDEPEELTGPPEPEESATPAPPEKA